MSREMGLSPTQDDGYSAARKHMVDSQVRPNRVSDPRILAAMRHLPREQFVPAALAPIAYADQTLELGSGRFMPQPMVQARLVQALEAAKGDKALVVGAGGGYSAALLQAMGCDVVALEEAPGLLDLARPALAAHATPVSLVPGRLTEGWPDRAPYDVILIDGAVVSIPDAIAAQLKLETGRLVAIVNEGRVGYAVLAERTSAGLSERPLFDCLCPILPGFAPAPAFEF